MYAREHVLDIVSRLTGAPSELLGVEERPLRGGLEGGEVAELRVRYATPSRRPGAVRLVSKHLPQGMLREAAVYERLVAQHAASSAPRVFSIVPGANGAILYMAAARRRGGWPWRDAGMAASVLATIAQLHASPDAARDVPPWDYDEELAGRADATLEALDGAARTPDASFVRASMPAARRIAGELKTWRAFLLDGPLAPCAIHGDLHTGNVVVTPGARPRVVLIDWARARIGSPFEDVCSWLQSLAFWEPAVRQRHDTVLSAYLAARGLSTPPSREIRDAYWLAGASNALSGALAYHLGVASTLDAAPASRARSLHAARDWLRILRRADAVWCRVRRGDGSRAEVSADRPSACPERSQRDGG